MTEMINLTEKGQEIGGFIDAVRDPFVFFIFGLGIALAVLGLIWEFVNVLGVSVSSAAKHYGRK